MSEFSQQGMKFVAIVPAAGIGSRMQTQVAKQYLALNDKLVIEHSIHAVLADPRIQHVVVALHPEDSQFSSLEFNTQARIHSVQGGATRAESVAAALTFACQHLAQPEQQLVAVVHDAARPCLAADDLSKLLDAFLLRPQQGAILACPVRDTMKRANTEGAIVATVERDQLWHAQTPQVFSAGALLDALGATPNEHVTDEASAMQAVGGHPYLVSGSASNLKITHPDDLAVAAAILERAARQSGGVHLTQDSTMFRIGQGFDVHKFGGEGPVYLGGIAIEHAQGLIAYSDGDVLLHALCDALLGALALGDIGHLFPDTDATYQGADSKELLRIVYQRVQQQGYRLVNADITVMAEAPKLKPHNVAIRECIAGLLNVDSGDISVKATTTEKLGFTGREEGIACQATVLLSRQSVQGASK